MPPRRTLVALLGLLLAGTVGLVPQGSLANAAEAQAGPQLRGVITFNKNWQQPAALPAGLAGLPAGRRQAAPGRAGGLAGRVGLHPPLDERVQEERRVAAERRLPATAAPELLGQPDQGAGDLSRPEAVRQRHHASRPVHPHRAGRPQQPVRRPEGRPGLPLGVPEDQRLQVVRVHQALPARPQGAVRRLDPPLRPRGRQQGPGPRGQLSCRCSSNCLDRTVQGARSKYVGLAAAAVQDGETVFAAHGAADASGGLVDERTDFEIGSVSKVFTALLLATMVGAGEVRLDDPLADFYPELTIPVRGRPVTLRDLATHTSGFPRLPRGVRRQGSAEPHRPLRPLHRRRRRGRPRGCPAARRAGREDPLLQLRGRGARPGPGATGRHAVRRPPRRAGAPTTRPDRHLRGSGTSRPPAPRHRAQPAPQARPRLEHARPARDGRGALHGRRPGPLRRRAAAPRGLPRWRRPSSSPRPPRSAPAGRSGSASAGWSAHWAAPARRCTGTTAAPAERRASSVSCAPGAPRWSSSPTPRAVVDGRAVGLLRELVS